MFPYPQAGSAPTRLGSVLGEPGQDEARQSWGFLPSTSSPLPGSNSPWEEPRAEAFVHFSTHQALTPLLPSLVRLHQWGNQSSKQSPLKKNQCLAIPLWLGWQTEHLQGCKCPVLSKDVGSRAWAFWSLVCLLSWCHAN